MVFAPLNYQPLCYHRPHNKLDSITQQIITKCIRPFWNFYWFLRKSIVVTLQYIMKEIFQISFKLYAFLCDNIWQTLMPTFMKIQQIYIPYWISIFWSPKKFTVFPPPFKKCVSTQSCSSPMKHNMEPPGKPSDEELLSNLQERSFCVMGTQV